MKRSAVLVAALAATLHAADWPEWRGAGRRGEWNETATLDRFPPAGLNPSWRTPIGGGYAGPAIAGGRVYVTDYRAGIERALALDETTGRILWTNEWPAGYKGLDYASGPRATPTVDGDRVYVQGAMGHLACLRVTDGAELWSKEFQRDFGTIVPAWGMSAAPLVAGDRLIVIVGGQPDAKVVALDKHSGRVLWKALSSKESEPGYSQPILVEAGQARQVIVWHAGALSALHPETGAVLWEHPFRIHMNTPIATPARSGPYLLISAFFQGARMFRLDADTTKAELIWRGQSDSERNTDTLNALMNTPLIDGGYIYGICNYGQMRCLKAATGERVWESQKATVELARNVSAFLVRHRDRVVIFNDRGELILARLKPSGYEEISRALLIKPTSKPGSRRELGAVVWTHPAFANRHIVVRNDEEIIRVSLAPQPERAP